MKSAPPQKFSGIDPFQLAGVGSKIELRNHSFFDRQFESRSYACQRMMHAHSGNLSHRCELFRDENRGASNSRLDQSCETFLRIYGLEIFSTLEIPQYRVTFEEQLRMSVSVKISLNL